MGDRSSDDEAFQRELDSQDPFLDEDWLRNIRFEAQLERDGIVGSHTLSLLGAGSSAVVFSATSADGADFALRTLRRDWSFPTYIRELPPYYSGGAHFEVGRLQRKLGRLVGDPTIDQVVPQYDLLYRMIVENLYYWPPFTQLTWQHEVGAIIMPFAVRLPGTRAKLEHLVTRARTTTGLWATRTLSELEGVDVAPELQPETVHENPLYVWGAAVLEGYFPGDLGPAVETVCDRLSADLDGLRTFGAQGVALAHLLATFAATDRFATFQDAVDDELRRRGFLPMASI